ncbi:MAG: sigma-70 family RNA polymerase sigma factor [Phycisphaerales bacterium]|nr:sigma-70 family RNA polymerase sigma factor [Phycisphaerales bacterium]
MNVTAILTRMAAGDESASAELWETVYRELRAIAEAAMRSERREHTLQPTAVVNEAFLRLAGKNYVWQDRAHFLAFASHIIRRILVDYARVKNTAKRGADWRRVVLEDLAFDPGANIDLLALDEALRKLAGLHERQARIVELRCFAGLTGEEIAHILKIDRSTVTQDWAMAKAWLSAELSGDQ